jgi:hypothetical protein
MQCVAVMTSNFMAKSKNQRPARKSSQEGTADCFMAALTPSIHMNHTVFG